MRADRLQGRIQLQRDTLTTPFKEICISVIYHIGPEHFCKVNKSWLNKKYQSSRSGASGRERRAESLFSPAPIGKLWRNAEQSGRRALCAGRCAALRNLPCPEPPPPHLPRDPAPALPAPRAVPPSHSAQTGERTGKGRRECKNQLRGAPPRAPRRPLFGSETATGIFNLTLERAPLLLLISHPAR